MKCSYCAEEIQDDAKKCRYCGEWLDSSNTKCPNCGHINSQSRVSCKKCGLILKGANKGQKINQITEDVQGDMEDTLIVTSIDKKDTDVSSKHEEKVSPFLKQILEKPKDIETRTQKSWYKTWWGILIILVCLIPVLGVLLKFSQNNRDTTESSKSDSLEESAKTSTPSGPNFIAYIVNTKTLNVRKEPNDTSQIVMTLKIGEEIYSQGIMEGDGWYKVQEFIDAGKTGYVKALYLIPRVSLGIATNYVSIIDFSWEKGYGLAKFNIKVKNTGPWSIKDIQFAITYFAPSGTMIDEGKETAYEVISAGTTKNIHIEELTHSQSGRASVQVINAKWEWEKGERNLDW